MKRTIASGLRGTLKLFFTGRIKFIEENKRAIQMEDEREFSIFRHVKIQCSEKPDPEALFIVRFRPMKIGPKANVVFSLLPMLIFMGFPGFREKLWCVDYDTGLCQGIYAWSSKEDAENYSQSIAMRFMAERSDPLSVKYEIRGYDKNVFIS